MAMRLTAPGSGAGEAVGLAAAPQEGGGTWCVLGMFLAPPDLEHPGSHPRFPSLQGPWCCKQTRCLSSDRALSEPAERSAQPPRVPGTTHLSRQSAVQPWALSQTSAVARRLRMQLPHRQPRPAGSQAFYALTESVRWLLVITTSPSPSGGLGFPRSVVLNLPDAVTL